MWTLLSDHGKTAWAYESVGDGLVHQIGREVQHVEDLVKDLGERMIRGKDTTRYRRPDSFAFDRTLNANSADQFYRYLKNGALMRSDQEAREISKCSSLPILAKKAAISGAEFYSSLQMSEGFWPGDYRGPMFLLPGLVITLYVTKVTIPAPHRREMLRYICNHQLPDGGWGLHIEQETSTMFGSVLNYSAMRLLGVSADDEKVQRARKFIKANGGATATPSWGKFWLAVLGVYEWDGIDSLLPELWLLPEFLPFHPSKFWCHCRMVYVPMTFIYGRRFTGDITPLVLAIRKEIYNEAYDEMDWKACRSRPTCPKDIKRPRSWLYNIIITAANTFERFHNLRLRDHSLKFLYEYICAEDEQTNFIDIGPVNKSINMLCRWFVEGTGSTGFKRHMERVEDYLWIAEDGMAMQGYNGSQLWDTGFAVLAMSEIQQPTQNIRGSLARAYSYIDTSQVDVDVKDRVKFFRHISKGGWPFSTYDHGWPIVDCTALGLQAVLKIHSSDRYKRRIDSQRLYDAVNVLLSFQNRDGGWATYELTRGPAWLELLNPSEIFADIMIDYSFVELSSSAIQALAAFTKAYPSHRRAEIQKSIDRGVKFIRQKQESDGGFYGNWGVCYTYGTWFAVEALVAGGVSKDDPSIQRACSFLISHQMQKDGGWGESYESSEKERWIDTQESQVVQTAWALLALMAANSAEVNVIDRGIQLLLKRQFPNGDWPQEKISGVFNKTCMITYTSYRNIFPLRALASYANYHHSKYEIAS